MRGKKPSARTTNKREITAAARHPPRVSAEPTAAPRIDRQRLHRALAKARAALLAERGSHGHWEGELSSSALSTATAVTALELWQRSAKEQSAVSGQRSTIESGLRWLAEHQNADGGWGDTVLSFSNISTTALCWAAFGAVPGAEAKWPETVRRAEVWLAEKCLAISNKSAAPKSAVPPSATNHSAPPLDRDALITAIIARYGKDRTFSVPILTMCALAGRLGEGKAAWRKVIQLPFELAALPQKFFAALRLPVVSYALPALIAIGQVRHHHLPTRNPLTRLLRDRARAKTLRVLERIQPTSGGFLEATPLTSFVTMSLAGSGHADHPVARRGVEFLLKSMRADGSWPIDTNLATWVTTLAVNALGPSIHEVMSAEERGRILEWLLAQQYRTVHPYTNAAPGGWAWTDLPGGVPDADDTAGALLALKHLSLAPGFSRGDATADGKNCSNSFSSGDDGHTRLKPGANEKEPQPLDPRVREAAIAGVKWLLDLQNRDGGIPTFCRGWTNLPFDRSSPDITAHALRAWLAWMPHVDALLQERLTNGIGLAMRYLTNAIQRPHDHLTSELTGSWHPLWFGNQHTKGELNATYGTSRVLLAMLELMQFRSNHSDWNYPSFAERKSRSFRLESFGSTSGKSALIKMQATDGGWGGGGGDSPASVEETALALEALSKASKPWIHPNLVASRNHVPLGTDWLLRRVEDGTWTQPAPIGFYFAKLWYYERLYPMVFTVAALEAVARLDEQGSELKQ